MSRTDRILRVATWLAVCGLAVLNIVLVAQNRSLKSGRSSGTDTSTINRPVAGQKMGRLAGVNLSGVLEEVPALPARSGLVVITFSTGCRFSRANYGRWTSLTRSLDRSTWRVVWVSPDPLPLISEFTRTHPIRDTVLTEAPHATYAGLGLGVVPSTIVINEQRVVRLWRGEFSPQSWKEVLAYFRLKESITN